MPRTRIAMSGGFVTNVDPLFLPVGRSSVALNWRLDDAGNSVGRPGLTAFSTPTETLVTIGGDTRIIGLFAWREWLLAANANRRLFRIAEDGTSVDITPIGGIPGNGIVTFLDYEGTRVIMCGGGAPQQWDGTGLAEQFAPDGSVPNATQMVVAQKYLLANQRDSDEIMFSRPESPLDWSTLEFFTAESHSDPVLNMLVQWGRLYLFGTRTLDVYYNVGAAQGDFAREWSIPTGLAARFAVTKVDNMIFFLGHDRKVYQLDGDSTPRIKSLPIENTLRELARVDDCVAHHVEVDGSHMVAFVFVASQRAFLYDYVHSTPGEDIWFEWQEWRDGAAQSMRMEAYAYHREWNRAFCAGGSLNQNTVYELRADQHTDDGEPIRRVRRFLLADDEVPKLGWAMYLKARRGGSTVTDATVKGYDPHLEVRFRDSGQGWGQPRRVRLGRQGDHFSTLTLHRLGRYRTREVELFCDEPVPVTLGRQLELHFEALED